QWQFSTVPAILVALVVGLAIGVWQGFWVSRFRIPSFVVTLSGLLAFRGIGFVWSDAATYAPMSDSYGAISESFIPPGWSVVLILAFVATGTVFGRQMYAIGGNREAAHLSGISIRRNLFLSFVIMGVVCAVAGVLTTARLNAIAPSVGQFLELDAIAAAVIGGVSLAGGIGTVYGALIGALLLVTVDNGMSLMDISSFIQLVVKGLLLGIAVLFDVATRPGGRRWLP